MKATDNPWPRSALSTTVFGASAVAVAAYTALTALLFAGFIWQANRVFVGNVLASLATHEAGFRAISETAGAATLAKTIARLAEVADNDLFLLTDPSGGKVAGNLAALPASLREAPRGGGVFAYQRASIRRTPANSADQSPVDSGSSPRFAAGLLVRFDDGRLLVIARDIEAQRQLLGWMRAAAVAAFLVIGLGGLAVGYLASRATLRRVAQLTDATRSIMSGDLSGRLPLRGNDDEFDQLSARVNEMLERIEHLMQGLKDVSDNIAHDLKTPVNRLRQSADQALRSAQTEADLRVALAATIESADEIIKTFNALLLIARLEAGAVEETKVEVDLAGLVGDVAELYEPAAEEAGAGLYTATLEPLRLAANRHLVGQAVVNLIDNALKYGCDHARAGANQPAIELAVRRRGDFAEIIVADNGPGISPADRQRAMERFVRLDKSRSSPGTGLGLSLVAAVARLHDGTLRLEDNSPGLRAILRLPLSSPSGVS